jgi:DNA ligase-1
MSHENIGFVSHRIITLPTDFQTYAAECLADGYEGAMIRDPEGPYKNGRSTLNQQWLVKYKEWSEAEGTVIGFEELYHNANEDVKDNFGYAKRSSAKDGMVPMDTLGALVLNTEWGELRVGTGFDETARKLIWERNKIPIEWESIADPVDVGRKVTFKYQSFGMQERPRFPVFLRFREEE